MSSSAEQKKSSFSVTCGLLSQFLREKRSLAELGAAIDITSRSHDPNKVRTPTTMSLLPGAHVSAADTAEALPSAEEAAENGSQLTIFYAGRVLVFDDFPADKANDLMQLAIQRTSAADSTAPALADRPPLSGGPSPSGSKPGPAQLGPDLPMPIARRASLHRFFEKRKDRVNSKAPYQVSGSTSSAAAAPQGGSSKPDEARSWLGLGSENSNPSENSHSSKD